MTLLPLRLPIRASISIAFVSAVAISTSSATVRSQTTSPTAVPAHATATQLLRVGQFHGNEVDAPSGERWYGLVPRDGGFSLRPTIVSVGPVFDPVLDEDDGPFTGKDVRCDLAPEPIVPRTS